MGRLNGKTALVTGASQGIGAAIAKELIDAGCNVCLHYFSSAEEPEHLKKMAIDKGQKAVCLHADLTNEKDVVFCVKKAVQELGSYDILVNNSGALVERRFIGYAALSANMLAFPADVVPLSATASVWGIASVGSGLGGAISQSLSGVVVKNCRQSTVIQLPIMLYFFYG
jgi:NAD(P)-dependent dehydrogenase (short-subunit alcohol dehydrogenase family)